MPRLGHIAFVCPNWKVIALGWEDEVKEEDLEEIFESNHLQDEEELTMPDDGIS